MTLNILDLKVREAILRTGGTDFREGHGVHGWDWTVIWLNGVAGVGWGGWRGWGGKGAGPVGYMQIV